MAVSEPDLSNIMTIVAQLRPGQSTVYMRGRTGFMRGSDREKEWVAWVEKMNRAGWHDFTQRRVGSTAPVVDFLNGGTDGGVGIFEYIARARHTQARAMRW